MATRREWIVLQSTGDGTSFICQVSNVAWFHDHYHEEQSTRSAFTSEGRCLRVVRAMVNIGGETLEVFESAPKVGLLIRGWDTDDTRLRYLGRIDAEGGPSDREHFELCTPETPDTRIDEILTEIDQRAAIWCTEHSDTRADPRETR